MTVTSLTSAPLARLRGVRHHYGKTLALDSLDLALPAGQVLALLGPNGAGKSTAISLLLGLQRADAGTADLFGLPPQSLQARRRAGVMLQSAAVPDTLKVGELIDLTRAYYPQPRSVADLVALVIWGGLIPPLPFLALSWWLEGPERIGHAIANISWSSVLALAYLAFVATMLGYSLWSKLLSRHPAGKVAPFSLLVPVIGLSSSALLLGERLTATQGWGALLVMAGLLVNVFGARLGRRLRAVSA